MKKKELSLLVTLFFTASCFSQVNDVHTPDTTNAPAYNSIDVIIHKENLTLSGTLFRPLNKKNPTVVLIISGSGPTDRDGNSPLLPGKNNSLLQLADSLAMHGIASLRYDKRGIGKSKITGIQGLREDDLTIDSIISDAKSMYDWLRSEGYKNILVAGHSEGSLIGLAVAGKVHPAGFISLEGAGRKAGDILKEQVNNQLPEPLKKVFSDDIDSLEKGFTVKNINPGLMSLLRPSIQPYMRSWLALDPQKMIAALTCPILIVQGTKDLQIGLADAQHLKQSSHASKLIIVPDMNHVLKKIATDNRDDNIKAYSDPSLPVASELIQGVIAFAGLFK